MTAIQASRGAITGVRVATTSDTMARLLLVAMVAAWPLAAAGRFVAVKAGVQFLYEGTPTDAFAAACTFLGLALLLRRGPLSRGTLLAACAGVLLVGILVAHLAFDAPENEGAWNSRPAELLRSGFLCAVMVAFIAASGERIGQKVAVRGLYAICFAGAVCAMFATLQTLHLLPNFYFQWYGPVQLGRPAGGFTHPHFFAASCVVAAAAGLGLLRSGHVSRGLGVAFVMAMMLAVAMSTSRVGLIFALLALCWYVVDLLRRRPRLAVAAVPVVMILGGLAGLYLVNVGVPDAIQHYVDVFDAAFNRADGDVLRGRQSYWAHEVELIFHSPLTTFFGYGHQPFVSHNLLLRQLQVGGIIGAVLYFALIAVFFVRSLEIAGGSRILIIVAWTPIILGAMTFPILISVPINLALALFALCIATVGQNPRTGSGLPGRARPTGRP